MLNRRAFLTASASIAATAAVLPAAAKPRADAGTQTAEARTALNPTNYAAAANSVRDQTVSLLRALEQASQTGDIVMLSAGTYEVGNITLPAQTRLHGVPGATRLVFSAPGFMLRAANAKHIELNGLVIDGVNRPLNEQVEGLCDFSNIETLVIDNCHVTGSSKHGLALDTVSGRIERSTISQAAEAGIYSVQAGRLAITGNTVSDCANNGILVHRWQPGDDHTMVLNNRVERIAAKHGGTGPFGNGVNVFRANKVMVSNNVIADCAFSAIRANAASDIQITSNTCLRSGETAIYSEFAFEGAIVSSNLVDGAANGISIVNYNEGGRLAVCNGNIVRNLKTDGPYPGDEPGFGSGITVEADTTVMANVIENAPLFGLRIGWGPYMRNVTATSNVIRNAGTGMMVSVVEGVGAAVISDNVIEGAANGGIAGYRWSERTVAALQTGANLIVERNKVG